MTLDDLGITHGFTERAGGVSLSPYDSLNFKTSLLVKDSVWNVAKNLEIVLSKIEPELENLALLYLEGETNVLDVESEGGFRTLYGADGAVSKVPGCTLAITVADCLPILMADKKAGVIGISHAGWKGSAGKITTKVVAEMVRLGAQPKDIVVLIGPGICGSCYEVGGEVAEKFESRFIKKTAGDRYLLDLHAKNKTELLDVGILRENLNVVEICTYENTHRFFSARKEKQTGRFLAYVTLPKT